MLLHYFGHHKIVDQDPLSLLERSKGGFDIRIRNPRPHKDVEINPKAVYLDPELRMIIDYKDSLDEANQLYSMKANQNRKSKNGTNGTRERIMKRSCGNLTASNQDDERVYIEHEDSPVHNPNNTSETCFNSGIKANNKPALSNLNQKEELSSESDPADNLILGKRNIDFDATSDRKGSITGDENSKRVKNEPRRSADKRVSRRCANLA